MKLNRIFPLVLGILISLLVSSYSTETIVAQKISPAIGQSANQYLYLPSVDNQSGIFPTPTPIGSSPQDPVILAAGDIASCSSPGAGETAAIVESFPQATVITLGDNAYPSGSVSNFTNCYNPTWGAFKNRTYPTPGNQEYNTHDAAGYFWYFGPGFGVYRNSWYSFDIGAWHLIAMDSNCPYFQSSCDAGYPEELWLKADLAAHPNQCILAYWHHPLFSSGKDGSSIRMQAFWQDLYAAHATLVLNGHNHQYERFAPQDPYGNADPTNGIVEIVAGTGGKSHYQFLAILPNSLVRDNTSWGMLKLTLHPHSYDFQFIPVAGATFTDSGSGSCHSS